MLSCFVNKEGQISLEKRPDTVEMLFDLSTKQIRTIKNIAFHGDPFPFVLTIRHFALADQYFKKVIGTPAQLMDIALKGHFSKLELAELLLPEKKNIYLDVCARFEKALTEACTAKNDPCLEDGCALEEETCLNAVLESKEIYTTAYVSAWIYLFINPNNRIPAWKN